jgi:hypothetical protein
LEYNNRAIGILEKDSIMKKRLRLSAFIVMMNHVLTPFSYAIAEDGDIFDLNENVVIENEIEVMGEDEEPEEEIVVNEETDEEPEEEADENTETNTGDTEPEPETNTGDTEPEPETNTGDNEPEPETNTGHVMEE